MNAKVQMVIRIFLGAILVLFGLNKFLNFLPPMVPGAEAGAFMGALVATGYMMPLVGLVEVVSGALLLSNKYVAIALLLLAPISVNIVAFHLFLDPANIVPALLVAIMNVYLLLANKSKFSGVLSA